MFKMGKAPPPPPASEKPLKNEARPMSARTTATENLLMTNRRKASDKFKQAQRAEQAYRSKKRSTVARANLAEAKEHWKATFSNLKMACKYTFAVLRFSPYLLGEKSEAKQEKAEEKKRAAALKKREKLEKQLASVAAMEVDDDDEPRAGRK